MTDHVSPGRTARRGRRCAVLLTAGVLTVPVLAGCGADDAGAPSAATQDIAPASRGRVQDGGTVRWAVDTMPGTFNAFHADADAATSKITGAVLPALFTLDGHGRPQRNADYLDAADITDREPRQVVVYKINPKARWSDGRRIGAADFIAQWKALRGKNNAFWTARNAGYDRIAKVAPGAKAGEVKVTFGKPYADWQSLFTPLYPKNVMGNANAFNDTVRDKLPVAAGPFAVQRRDSEQGTVTLVRNPRWWGAGAKLDRIVLTAVARDKRAAALAAGRVDIAELDPAAARKVETARDAAPVAPRKQAGNAGPPAERPDDAPRGAVSAEAVRDQAIARGSEAAKADAQAAAEARTLRGYTLHKALEPAYTQLALNGGSGPLSDDRVRRAVARALDRQALADTVLKPLGLPARPLGSHLRMAGQDGYQDHSDALGGQDTEGAKALLADAGWRAPADGAKEKDGVSPRPAKKAQASPAVSASASAGGARADGRNGRDEAKGGDRAAAPVPTVKKNGKPLALRFVLPNGPGSEQLRTVGDRIAAMLARIGVATTVEKVDEADYFQDHIAAGDFDLALYSWPGTAYPATDARPLYAKPQPAPDGSLTVEQNYARVGTDRIDQLFDQAVAELDQEAAHEVLAKADARIWAAAGSIPLYQRPHLVATRKSLANVGAFGFASPRFQDIGYRK